MGRGGGAGAGFSSPSTTTPTRIGTLYPASCDSAALLHMPTCQSPQVSRSYMGDCRASSALSLFPSFFSIVNCFSFIGLYHSTTSQQLLPSPTLQKSWARRFQYRHEAESQLRATTTITVDREGRAADCRSRRADVREDSVPHNMLLTHQRLPPRDPNKFPATQLFLLGGCSSPITPVSLRHPD